MVIRYQKILWWWTTFGRSPGAIVHWHGSVPQLLNQVLSYQCKLYDEAYLWSFFTIWGVTRVDPAYLAYIRTFKKIAFSHLTCTRQSDLHQLRWTSSRLAATGFLPQWYGEHFTCLTLTNLHRLCTNRLRRWTNIAFQFPSVCIYKLQISIEGCGKLHFPWILHRALGVYPTWSAMCAIMGLGYSYQSSADHNSGFSNILIYANMERWKLDGRSKGRPIVIVHGPPKLILTANLIQKINDWISPVIMISPMSSMQQGKLSRLCSI